MPVATWNPLSELRTLIVALAIAGLATVHGGSAFAQTVPEIAPGAVMFVVTVAESLAGFGSGVRVVADTVLLTDPLDAVTFTTRVNVWPLRIAKFPKEQFTVPVLFTACARPGAGEPATRLSLIVPLPSPGSGRIDRESNEIGVPWDQGRLFD